MKVERPVFPPDHDRNYVESIAGYFGDARQFNLLSRSRTKEISPDYLHFREEDWQPLWDKDHIEGAHSVLIFKAPRITSVIGYIFGHLALDC